MAERCVRERLERLGQRTQRVRGTRETVGVVEAAVERVNLGAQAVEAFEHGVELPVG